MFPLINKRETGVNLRRIMDMRGVTPKDVQSSKPACRGSRHEIYLHHRWQGKSSVL